MQLRGELLQNSLASGVVYELRDPEYRRVSDSLVFTEAFAMAVACEVEGIATASGRIKYLRLLPHEEVDAMREAQRVLVAESASASFDPDRDGTGCLMPSNLCMGVYKEKVTSTIDSGVRDLRGLPIVDTVVIGHVYQFYGARV